MTYPFGVSLPDPTGSRRLPLPTPLLLILAAVMAVCLLAAWRPWAGGATVAGDGADRSPAAIVAPEPLILGDDTRMLVFGDSWTYGSAATVRTDGYAFVTGRLLGWDTVVDGVRGSGYLKPGIDGPAFGERIAALDADISPDLIVVQGSINDRRRHTPLYLGEVRHAWDALAARFPDAAIVILGPAPQVLPVEPATAAIDADLATLAADRAWWYISPLAEEWITDENYLDVIDVSDIGRDHPSTQGHAYLAERLAAALRSMQATTDAAASDPAPEA